MGGKEETESGLYGVTLTPRRNSREPNKTEEEGDGGGRGDLRESRSRVTGDHCRIGGRTHHKEEKLPPPTTPSLRRLSGPGVDDPCRTPRAGRKPHYPYTGSTTRDGNPTKT